MTDAGWRLPIGDTLDERRALAILARFSPEAKRLGADLAERLRAEHPARLVEGRVFGVRALLAAYQHPRGAEAIGLTLGMVAYEPSGGGIRVVAIVLEWESGRVVARE